MPPAGFTPFPSLFGGVLIGLAAVLLMATTGRVAGVSGIVSRLLTLYRDQVWPQRVAFVAGLLVAPFLYVAITRLPVEHVVSSNFPLLTAAGFLTGFGAVLGNGCTSGHGVCGIARFSKRSLAATIIFMLTAIVTVYVARHVVGS